MAKKSEYPQYYGRRAEKVAKGNAEEGDMKSVACRFGPQMFSKLKAYSIRNKVSFAAAVRDLVDIGFEYLVAENAALKQEDDMKNLLQAKIDYDNACQRIRFSVPDDAEAWINAAKEMATYTDYSFPQIAKAIGIVAVYDKEMTEENILGVLKYQSEGLDPFLFLDTNNG